MRYLITGGLGFIGANFIEEIQSKKNYILNIDKISKPSNIHLNTFFKKNSNYKFIKGDISKIDLYKIILNFKPDFIINFAAESHVDNSIKSAKFFRLEYLWSI